MERTELCLKAGAAVRDAGKYLRRYYGNVHANHHSEKSHPTDFDVVTVHDVKVETDLRAAMTAIDPTIGYTGEENGCYQEADSFWLVDPIDGTDAFIRGLPFCTIQLALIESGVPTIGIIYDFVKGELVMAVKGQGTVCYNKNARHKVTVSDRDLRTGRMIIETDIRNDANNLNALLEMRRRSTMYQCCASGWEFIQIACGRMEGKITLKPWAAPGDLAAGHLLVSEAGGVVTNIGNVGYNFLNTDAIAGNPVVHRELTEGPNALFPIA